MRLWTAAIVIGAVALPLAGCNRHEQEQQAAAKKAAVVETPTRKSGLWSQVTDVEGIGSIPAVALCLDQATDKKISWWAQQGTRGGCTKNDINKNADGSWSFASSCQTEGGIHTTTDGVASGDFRSAYKVEATSTTEGAPMVDMNGTHHVVITAKWEGPCPSDMKPGDMRLPDGSIMNMSAVGVPAPGGVAQPAAGNP